MSAAETEAKAHAPSVSEAAGAKGSGDQRAQGRLRWVLALTLTFFGFEFAGGRLARSLVLQMDALHLLMDIAALAMSLFAMKLAARPAKAPYGFGYHRAEPLAALLNATLVLFAVKEMLERAVDLFSGGETPEPRLMLMVACGALVVNGISAWILHGAMHDHGGHHHGHAHHGHDHHGHAHHDHDHAGHKHHDHDEQPAGEPAHTKHAASMNLRGAWLHLMGDFLGSLAALAAAVAIRAGMPAWVDPLASVLVAGILLFGALRLIRDATRVLMDAAPPELSIEAVTTALTELGATQVSDCRVWTLGAGKHALAAKVTSKKGAGALEAAMQKRFGFHWLLVQVQDAHEEQAHTHGPECDHDHHGG
jgi:cation diffusion facilitator family transporter